jgi:hypothetical protein
LIVPCARALAYGGGVTSLEPIRRVDPRRQGDGDRWRVVRDLAVFQLKLFLGGLKDVVLAPVSIVAVIAGFALGKGDRFFYPLLRLGRACDRWVRPYAVIENDREAGGLDEHIDRIEATIRR